MDLFFYHIWHKKYFIFQHQNVLRQKSVYAYIKNQNFNIKNDMRKRNLDLLLNFRDQREPIENHVCSQKVYSSTSTFHKMWNPRISPEESTPIFAKTGQISYSLTRYTVR